MRAQLRHDLGGCAVQGAAFLRERLGHLPQLEAAHHLGPLAAVVGLQLGPGLAPHLILGDERRAIPRFVRAVFGVERLYAPRLVVGRLRLRGQLRELLADFALPPADLHRFEHFNSPFAR
jgi:hypothetical protein